MSITFISIQIDAVVGYSSVLSIFVTSVSSMSCLLCEHLVLVVNDTFVLKSNILLFEKRCALQFFEVNSGICVGTSYTCVVTPIFPSLLMRHAQHLCRTLFSQRSRWPEEIPSTYQSQET